MQFVYDGPHLGSIGTLLETPYVDDDEIWASLEEIPTGRILLVKLAEIVPLRETFCTPHEDLARYNGQPFEILRVITEPDKDHAEEVLPMIVVQFPDGTEHEVWPDEVAAFKEGSRC